MALEPLAECSGPDLAGAAWLLNDRDPAAASLLCTLAHHALEHEDCGVGDW
jgi:hypothetical protein